MRSLSIFGFIALGLLTQACDLVVTSPASSTGGTPISFTASPAATATPATPTTSTTNPSATATPQAATTPTPSPTPVPTPVGAVSPATAVPGTTCSTSSGLASYFDCTEYFNLNFLAEIAQVYGGFGGGSPIIYFAQLVCKTLFPTSTCPGSLPYWSNMATTTWTNQYSAALLTNLGASGFGTGGLQVYNNISMYLPTNSQASGRTYTIDTTGPWQTSASDIYQPYITGNSRTALSFPAPPYVSGPLAGFSSVNGEQCDGTDCYYITLDPTLNQLIEIRGAKVTASTSNMIGTNLSLTLTATSPLTVGPTVAVWPISQILTLNSNVTPVDKFGYYQRERCSTADASGLMIAPMTITKAELTAGYIKHAVRFVLPNKKVAPYTFVRPASHYPFDASKLVPGTPQLVKTAAQPAQNSLMPYGSLLRLLPFCASGVTQTNPPTSCITTPSGMSTYDHILYTALQTYGMYLADSVSDSKNAGFSATQDVDPTQFTTLSQMPVNAFEVMVTPSAFNPGSIYNALAVNDPYEFTGSDANGIPIAAWSTTVAAACLRATVSTSTLQTW